METANVGHSIWTFTPSAGGSYAGEEQGLGNATGTAVMNGNTMRLDWRTGGFSGLVEVLMDPACLVGQGWHIFNSGRTGSEATRWTRVDAVPASASSQAAPAQASASAGGAPSPIRLEAVIGGRQLTAVLTRTGPEAWEWVESGATFRFRPVLDTPSRLVIHDAGRDIYHRLNFATGTTAWRIGTIGGGDGRWIPHYTIVAGKN
jgi:hypothetical protein